MDWATQKVIETAGIPLEDADGYLIALAECALARCYYIDRAAEYLHEILQVHLTRR